MPTEEELRRMIEDVAVDGKVACKALLDLAHETNTPPARIGRLCNEINVRIHGCQLGCFK